MAPLIAFLRWGKLSTILAMRLPSPCSVAGGGAATILLYVYPAFSCVLSAAGKPENLQTFTASCELALV